MAKDITLKDKNGGIKYPKTVTAIVYENGTGKTLQTIIDEMRQVDAATDTRTQHFKADVNNLDTLKNKTDIGLYNYVGNGWRGSVSVCYDSADNVSQVALSSSTPSYNGNTLTWLSAQPCAMARTYTNGAWSHWEKVGAPVVNDLTTGGTDKALSAEMGKTLKDGLDALGPKCDQIENESASDDSEVIIVQNDAGTDTILAISESGVDAKNLKSNGQSVLTQHQDISHLATKEEMADKQDKIDELSSIESMSVGENDTIVIEDEEGNKIAEITSEGADFKNLKSNGIPVATGDDEIDTLEQKVEENTQAISSLEDDVALISSIQSISTSFYANAILSDIIGRDVFVKEDYLMKNTNNSWSYSSSEGNNATSFVNIDGVSLIEYINLHEEDLTNGYYPIYLYTENFTKLAIPTISINQNGTSGSVDITQYPLAKYAVFNDNGNGNVPLIKMYVQTEAVKRKRNNLLVGCYYFAGFFETTFPNIHNTEALLTTYNGRKPIFGWIGNGCFKGEGWLITPSIELGSGTSTLTITHSCLFHSANKCGVYVRDIDDMVWHYLSVELPSATKTTMSETEVSLSSYAGKTVQIGFRLRTSASEESAIWTINAIDVTSDNESVYSRDYTDHTNMDCEITDGDVWKASRHTMAYEGVNGYVGSTYDPYDSSKIDKEIILAKNSGIDYFMLEWFYHDDQSSINTTAIDNEENHIGIKAMMRAANKLNFKFALMITNHSPFRIEGLENWEDVFRYLDANYFKDPSYLIVDNKPVVCIFDKTDYRNYSADIDAFFISELGYDGVYILFTGYNSVPNSGNIVERDIDDLYNRVKDVNISLYTTSGNYKYNVVPYITCGWDSRPWAVRPSGYSRATDWFTPNLTKWKNMFSWAYDFTKVYTNGKFRSMLICAWNEMGEGSYLVPTDGDRMGCMLTAIRDIINNKKI